MLEDRCSHVEHVGLVWNVACAESFYDVATSHISHGVEDTSKRARWTSALTELHVELQS